MQLSDELKTLLANPELWDAVREEIDAEVHAWITQQSHQIMNANTFMWHDKKVTSFFPSAEAIDECNAKLMAESSKNGLPYYPYIPMIHLGE